MENILLENYLNCFQVHNYIFKIGNKKFSQYNQNEMKSKCTTFNIISHINFTVKIIYINYLFFPYNKF